MEGTIGRAIELRRDFNADMLRQLARASRDSNQTRRLLALAAIYKGRFAVGSIAYQNEETLLSLLSRNVA